MPNISNADFNRMARAEKELAQMRTEKLATPFAEAFRDNVWLLINTMPRADWPTWVQTSYEYAAREKPASAMYWEDLRRG